MGKRVADMTPVELEKRRELRRRHYEGNKAALKEQVNERHAKLLGIPEAIRARPDRCEACLRPAAVLKHGLCREHDHQTGTFRGWLCIRCNSALGQYGDSVEGLQLAAKRVAADKRLSSVRRERRLKNIARLTQYLKLAELQIEDDCADIIYGTERAPVVSTLRLRGYTLNEQRYIVRDGSLRILGRASGNAPGAYWYQLAAKPYDEPEVMGLATLEAAFGAAVAVLEARAVEQ